MAAGLAEELLSGPRGRRLCWSALDAQSFQRTGRCELHRIEDGGRGRVLPALQRVIAETDLGRFASSGDVVGFLELASDSVDRARYWQEPDEVDNFGTPSARCWPVRTSRSPRVFEICGDHEWRRLTERYPIEVTFGRRGNWDQATGRTGRWLLPDWSLVLQDDDAVPLSAMVYFAASGRVLALERDVATLIAGWNADETYWLTDVLAFAGAPTDWAAADHHPSRTWHPLKGRVE